MTRLTPHLPRLLGLGLALLATAAVLGLHQAGRSDPAAPPATADLAPATPGPKPAHPTVRRVRHAPARKAQPHRHTPARVMAPTAPADAGGVSEVGGSESLPAPATETRPSPSPDVAPHDTHPPRKKHDTTSPSDPKPLLPEPTTPRPRPRPPHTPPTQPPASPTPPAPVPTPAAAPDQPAATPPAPSSSPAPATPPAADPATTPPPDTSSPPPTTTPTDPEAAADDTAVGTLDTTDLGTPVDETPPAATPPAAG